MSTDILSGYKLYVGDFDLSGNINALGASDSAQLKDATTIADTVVINKGGLKVFTFSHQGFWDSDIDAQLFSNLGISDIPMIYAPGNGADGQICHMLKTVQGEYNPAPKVGEMYGFSYSGVADQKVRGTIMANLASQASSANGTARQLGAVSAIQSVYATLHVLAASGSSPTLDATVNSDDAEGFPSTTQRIAFTQATGITSQWSSLIGPITDDWWRIEFTIGGGSPSFDFVVSVGIK